MADRQDIDALMVGALYGELDDGERARLEAHLASHPQDRSGPPDGDPGEYLLVSVEDDENPK